MPFSLHKTKGAAMGTAFLIGALLGTAGTGIAATMLGSSVFTDVATGSFYDSAIGEMYNDGILKGYDGTQKFGPDDFVTRGQVAVMMQRLRDDINGVSAHDDRSSSSRSRSSSSSSQSSSSTSTAVNNPKGTFRFTTASYSVPETQNSVNITVVRVGGNDGSVAVNYAVTAGTATAGSDFDVVSGTLNFASKETSKTFTVAINDDSTSEGNETATVTLSSPANGASLGNPATATITITDNESSSNSSSSTSGGSTSSANPKGTLSLSALTYSVNENAGSITINVERTGGSTSSVGVNYATSNGTGLSGTDYTPASGTLSFASGETVKSFTVTVMDDSSIDGGKTFYVTLSSITGGASMGTSSATVMMQDNENDQLPTGTGSFKFTKSTVNVGESEGKVVLTVQRMTGYKGTVSINYNTTNGTAFSGADYTATSGTLTFAPGETSKIITVPIVKDSSSEQGDTFYVDLSSGSGNAELTTPSSVLVNIYD